MHRDALCRSRGELSNAYLLAKFGFDTAENEPSKFCLVDRPDDDLARTRSPEREARRGGPRGGKGPKSKDTCLPLFTLQNA